MRAHQHSHFLRTNELSVPFTQQPSVPLLDGTRRYCFPAASLSSANLSLEYQVIDAVTASSPAAERSSSTEPESIFGAKCQFLLFMYNG